MLRGVETANGHSSPPKQSKARVKVAGDSSSGWLHGSQMGSLPSLLILTIAAVALSYLSAHLHYALPRPAPLPATPTTPSFSEANAMAHIEHLAGTIGYRIVGTRELTQSLDYVVAQLEELKQEAAKAGSQKEIEISHQKGDGAHLFEFMDKNVWKKYYQLSNIVVRLSEPSIPSSKHNAVLVNAHVDSTLPSPGAADDLVGVTVMFEAIRVIMNSPEWRLHNSVVFLFNGAEESLQDASHLFMTKHPFRDSVRTVINLEACGTGGPEILFQATSEEMVRAYAKVPRPYGTIVATEVFQTGLILSETDFRQFELYGNLTGLDMALIQNSYLYHTRQDVPSQIEPGAITHMGENTLALLKHLTAEGTEISSFKRSTNTVFFSGFGGHLFVTYSKRTALQIYVAIAAVAAVVAWRGMREGRRALYVVTTLAAPLTLVGGVVSANIVAFVTSTLLGKPMSWYRHEAFPVLFFGPPTLLGGLVVQLGTAKFCSKRKYVQPGDHLLAHATLIGNIAYAGALSVLGGLLGVGSTYLVGLSMLSLTTSLILNDLIIGPANGRSRHIYLGTYVYGLFIPCMLGVEGILGFLDIFVPLTGRMGYEPAVDHIIAVLVGVMGNTILTIIWPLSHRYGRTVLRRAIGLCFVVTVVLIFVFTRDSWQVFDHAHPKRVPVLHMENISTTPPTFSLHVASMDRAEGFAELVQESMDAVSISGVPVMDQINDEIPDWDIIYPVSQFLKSYKVPLPPAPASYVSPWPDRFAVRTISSKLDHIKRRRTVKIEINHPDIIWSVIAFTADVVSWDLPEPPERGVLRHHVKEASAFGEEQWTLEMTLQMDETTFAAAQRNEQRLKGQREGKAEIIGQIRIDYSGLDELGLYPAKASRGGLDGRPGMAFFHQLDVNLPNYLDPMLLSAIANVAYV